MIISMIKKFKSIILLVAIILLILSILLLFYDIGIIFFILPLEIIILSWIFTKGKWEKFIKTEEAIKWKKSIIFNIYLVLFILNSIIEIYYLINRPLSLSNDPTSYINPLTYFAFAFVTIGNIIFIFFLMWKKAPKQILSLPITSVIITFIISNALISLGFWEDTLTYSIILILLFILNILWAFYIRFIFLRKK